MSRTTPPRAEWFVRTPCRAIDARDAGLENHLLRFHQILDGYCRDKPYCFAGNKELQSAYGCRRRNLQKLLEAMEDAGVILRVLPGAGGGGARIGIVLRRRVDPHLPAADTPERLERAIAELRAARVKVSEPEPDRRPRRVAKAQPSAPALTPDDDDKAQSIAPGKAQPIAPSNAHSIAPVIKTRSSSNKDAMENDGPRTGPESEDPGRRRPEPTPPAPAPPPPPAVGPPAARPARPARPAPRRRFVFGLPEITSNDQLIAILGRDDFAAAKLLSEPKGEPPPPPPEGTPLPDLIRALATHELRKHLPQRISRELVDLFDDNAGSRTFWERLCGGIIAGRLDQAEVFAATVEKVLAAAPPGGPIRNRAGYLSTSLREALDPAVWPAQRSPAPGGYRGKVPPGAGNRSVLTDPSYRA